MALQQVNDQEFKDMLSTKDKVLVKFYADWCGACKLISPKVRRLSEEERFAEVAFVDINAEQNEEARKMAGVEHLPYFAIFKDGKMIEGSATSKIEQVEALLLKLN